MLIEESSKFESSLELAAEAKKLRDRAGKILKQAEGIEKKAVVSFRQVREEMLENLQSEKEKLEEERKALKDEYFKLARIFCEQKRYHLNITRRVITSWKPKYHSFSEGDVYPTEAYSTCLVCGSTDDPKNILEPRKFYQEGSEYAILEASEQSKNLELKRTAQRILEIREEFKKIDDKFAQNSEGLKEICILFGHDAEKTSYDSENFKCKCCGKEMEYSEYINAHYKAKYKGGIVPFYYNDGNYPIF